MLVPPGTTPSAGPLGAVPGFLPSVTQTPIQASSARQTPGSQAQSVQSLLNKPSSPIGTVEQKLNNINHEITELIWVKNPSGSKVIMSDGSSENLSPTHARVTNSQGQDFLVELDTEGESVTFNPQNSRVVSQTATAVLSPRSRMIGTEECASLGGTCGVAYDCNGDVCISKMPSGASAPTRVLLTKTSTPGDQVAMIEGAASPLVIVRLSDLLSSTIETLSSVEEAMARIRQANLEACLADWKKLKEACNNFDMALDKLENITLNKINLINEDIARLQDYRAVYLQALNSPDDTVRAAAALPREVANNASVVATLQNRMYIFNQVMAYCRELPIETDELNKLTASLNNNINYLSNLTKDLGMVSNE